MRGNNRIPTRLIHSSQSVDKKFKKKKENRKENLYRDVFLLEENNEEESEEDSSSDINIVILYNKEKINTKFSQNRPFCDFVKFLEKKYFKVGLKKSNLL